MSDLIEDCNRDRRLFLEANRNAKRLGRAYAEAEAAYYAAKNRRALEMSSDGVPATLIAQIIKGDPEVNELYLNRLCAEVDYKSEQEAVNSYKLSARLLEEQIRREWSMAGGAI